MTATWRFGPPVAGNAATAKAAPESICLVILADPILLVAEE